MKGIKIWWQSSTAIEGFPEYRKAIENHAKKVLNPGTEIEVYGVDQGTSELHYHYFAFLNTQKILENLLRAQREGFDAVAIGCGMDPGLEEAKEVLDIPVLSLSETGMLIACMLGRKFTVITHHHLLDRKRIDFLIQRYGLESRSVHSKGIKVDLNVLGRSFKNPKPILTSFKKAIKGAIRQGAEVVIPGCNILNLVAVQNRFYQVDGVPILDVAGVLMKMTESMVSLKRACGVQISRRGLFESPGKLLVSNVRKIYGRE